MKDRSERPSKPNRHSELLNGKRPEADARLLSDILRAEDRVTIASRPAAVRPAPSQPKRHETHIESKSTHQPGVTTWD